MILYVQDKYYKDAPKAARAFVETINEAFELDVVSYYRQFHQGDIHADKDQAMFDKRMESMSGKRVLPLLPIATASSSVSQSSSSATTQQSASSSDMEIIKEHNLADKTSGSIASQYDRKTSEKSSPPIANTFANTNPTGEEVSDRTRTLAPRPSGFR